MDGAMLEFLAEDTMVTVVPSARIRRFHFISGDFGPLDPSIPIDLPLWLAVYLKRNQRCQIQCPEWLEAERLAQLLEEERTMPGFVPLPYHYVEIGTLLLDAAAGDIEDAQRVRALLMDLQNVRQEKIRRGMGVVLSRTAEGDVPNAIKMNNVSAIEIQGVRDFMTSTMSSFNRFATREDAARFAALASANAARVGEIGRASQDENADEENQGGARRALARKAAEAAEARADRAAADTAAPAAAQALDEDVDRRPSGPRRKIRRFR
jgi:GINS complex subunit 2